MKHIAMITAISVFLLKLGSVYSYAEEVVSEDTVGPWTVTTEKDDFTDKISITASNTGKTFLNSYDNERQPLLVIFCSNDQTIIAIEWGGDIITFEGHKSMDIRTDDELATKKDYPVKESTVLVAGGEPAIRQVKSMFDNSTLKARISIGDTNSYTATTSFDISRLEEAIKPVRELCNW